MTIPESAVGQVERGGISEEVWTRNICIFLNSELAGLRWPAIEHSALRLSYS
jgi:hypothetical protein